MEGGDVDILLMDKCRRSSSLLESVLYKDDVSIGLANEDNIILFFNAGPESKEFIMQYDFSTEEDLSEIENHTECLFYCIGNKKYIKVLKTEKSAVIFDLMNRIRYEKRVASSSEKGAITIMENINVIANDNKSIMQPRKMSESNFYQRNESKTEFSNKLLKLITSIAYSDTDLGEYLSLSNTKRKALVPQSKFYTGDVVHVTVAAPQTGKEYKYTRTTARYTRESQDSRDNFRQPIQLPKHPEYADEFERLRTFDNWMYERVQDPKKLSHIGFFWTKMMDLVRCFFCGLGLKDFANTDDPLMEHVRYSENCGFLVNAIDTAMFNDVKAKLVQTDPEFCRRQQWQDIQSRPSQVVPKTSLPVFRHPHLSRAEDRLRTFSDWSRTITQTPEQLARAGFFYTGDGDIVRCWACDGGLQRWDPTDDPWIEHCRWFPACPFALAEKGEEYIKLVQHAVDTGDETQLQAASGLPMSNQDDLVNGMNGLAVGCTGGENAETRNIVYQLQEMGFEGEHIQSAVSRLKERGKIELDIERVIEEIETIQKPSLPFLVEENKRLKNKMICEACKIANREALFLPCKHLRMCMACSENVFRCPVCNANILHKIKTYIS